MITVDLLDIDLDNPLLKEVPVDGEASNILVAVVGD